MVRALIIDYPQDKNVWHIDDQYLFGDSILIAPILEPLSVSKTRTLYLPKGEWYDYWTKEKITSTGEWIEINIDIETMPMYVKCGTTLKYQGDRPSTYNEVGEIIRVETYDNNFK